MIRWNDLIITIQRKRDSQVVIEIPVFTTVAVLAFFGWLVALASLSIR